MRDNGKTPGRAGPGASWNLNGSRQQAVSVCNFSTQYDDIAAIDGPMTTFFACANCCLPELLAFYHNHTLNGEIAHG